MLKNYLSLGLILSVCLIFAAGCATTNAPHMGFKGIEWQPQMERKDYVVLDDVKGSSETLSILFGLVQIIDGNKVRLLWFIPCYEEKWSPVPGRPFSGMFPSTDSRAYYDALTKSPDADVVLIKSNDKTFSGVPLIASRRCVTYTGKAIKIKPDQP